jgi:hypothetical protein
LRPGNSRNYFLKKFARASDRVANSRGRPRSKTGRRGSTPFLSCQGGAYVRATTTRSPPLPWDRRAVAGCRVDWHERFGDAYDHGETVQSIQRQRPGFARRGDRMAQFTAADSGGPTRQSRPRRLLDVHLHQLAPHSAVHPRVGRGVQRTRAGRHRRAHTGILVRGKRRQRAAGRNRARHHVSHCHR